MALSPLKTQLYAPDEKGMYVGLLEAAKEGRLEELHAVLVQNGERFTVEDMLARDKNGRPTLSWPALMQHIDFILGVLHSAGESFTTKQLMETYRVDAANQGGYPYGGGYSSNAQTILGELANRRLLKKFFQPQLWTERVEDMEEMWLHIPMSSQGSVNFEDLRSQAVALGQRKHYTDPTYTLADLFTPNASGRSPLEYPHVWDKLPQIAHTLAQQGEVLTLSTLAQPTPNGSTYLHKGIGFYKLEKILTFMKETGQLLQPEDLALRDPASGKTVIEILAKQVKLSQVINGSMWVHRVQQLHEALEMVPEDAKSQIDAAKVIREANMLSLRALMDGGRNRAAGMGR